MRKAVVQSIYAWLMEADDPYQVLYNRLDYFSVSSEDADRARTVLTDVMSGRAAVDAELSSALEHWDLERVGVVERSIIYLALHEIWNCPDVPLEVAIDEAVRLAKEFAGEDSARFVNGIIDAASAARSGTDHAGGS